MTAGVEIHRYHDEGVAECQNCDRLPAECTRERARQHARQRGHTVHFVITDTTVYRPEGTS
jgi:ATP-dependent Clp protease adapter protein ClpS